MAFPVKLVFLSVIHLVSPFSILNLEDVEFVLTPPKDLCESTPPAMLAVVHSAPLQWQLRDAIR